jgi:hypothetical protein
VVQLHAKEAQDATELTLSWPILNALSVGTADVPIGDPTNYEQNIVNP